MTTRAKVRAASPKAKKGSSVVDKVRSVAGKAIDNLKKANWDTSGKNPSPATEAKKYIRPVSPKAKKMVREVAAPKAKKMVREVAAPTTAKRESPPAAVTKTKGGDYPVYKKDSGKAQSFRDAFSSARKAGKKTFTWEGRSYTTAVK
jgi:hypothetical protein